MQREIDDLKKKLCRAQRKQSPSSSDGNSNDEDEPVQSEDGHPLKGRSLDVQDISF